MVAQAFFHFLQRCGQLQNGGDGRQGCGNVVVAVHSCHFFDDIGFDGKIVAIWRNTDDQIFPVTSGVKLEPQKQSLDLNRAEVDADNAVDSAGSNLDLPQNFGFRVSIGNALDRIAACNLF